jgi:hypothetical protein
MKKRRTPAVCARCKPLLATTQKAFRGLRRDHGQVLLRLDEAYREVRYHRARLRDARADCRALVDGFIQAHVARDPRAEVDVDLLLDYLTRAYELGRRSVCQTCGGAGEVGRPGWPEICSTCRGQGVTPSVTP